jgi:excisionase family DNA binding protein
MKQHVAETPIGQVFTSLPPSSCAALPINTAGEYIGVGRTMIYELLKKGAIRSVRVGSRNLVLRSSLDEYIQSRIA